jgi:hypothetical protein
MMIDDVLRLWVVAVLDSTNVIAQRIINEAYECLCDPLVTQLPRKRFCNGFS